MVASDKIQRIGSPTELSRFLHRTKESFLRTSIWKAMTLFPLLKSLHWVKNSTMLVRMKDWIAHLHKWAKNEILIAITNSMEYSLDVSTSGTSFFLIPTLTHLSLRMFFVYFVESLHDLLLPYTWRHFPFWLHPSDDTFLKNWNSSLFVDWPTKGTGYWHDIITLIVWTMLILKVLFAANSIYINFDFGRSYPSWRLLPW